MAAINDLISRIQDPELRAQIQAEVNKLSRQKKFGLVFEDHIPECTPLYELPIRVGTLVAKKDGSVNDLMIVTAITEGKATCIYQKDAETVEYPLDQLVAVARFGEPIYPYLQPIDTVCNAPDSDLWHTLIQADNYHALQLLEYRSGLSVPDVELSASSHWPCPGEVIRSVSSRASREDRLPCGAASIHRHAQPGMLRAGL